MSSTERLDVLLAARGLAPSRERARRLILAGLVLVDGRRADHAGDRVRGDAEVRVLGPDHDYVSRGGVKLAHALDVFDVDVAGRTCVDVGASTGGFTDCLVQRGAARVHAVDVGYGQLAWKLRCDDRVVVHERTNARTLPPRSLDPAPSLAVVDASFISLRLLLPAILAQLDPPGEIVALVKPQFEVGRERVGRGGVVREPEARADAVAAVVESARELGLRLVGSCESPIRGAKKGNVELLVHLAPDGPNDGDGAG
ncbi:TlyA family RNA methyltransferase [bacterium]|nr:TlyA family RNA methyltransferase [bacterium]